MPRSPWRPLFLAALLVLSVLVAPAGAASAREPGTAAAVHGLKGEYFRMSAPGARDFADLGGIALDPNIDLPGLAGTFEAFTGRTEHTTARWTGKLTAPATGDYTFHMIGDNGFRFFLDGQPVIDHWVGDWDREQVSAAVPLVAGEAHDVRIEMFQDIGGANLFLRWSGAGLDKQIVPESAFTPPDGFQIFPVDLTVGLGGTTLVADFAAPVTALGDLTGHLSVEVDTTRFPIAAARIDRRDTSKVVITLGEAVQKGQKVRVNYDGGGGLTVGGETVPQVIRSATNTSEHRLTTPWGDRVDKRRPLPEYPRPQLIRKDWLNLNGQWEFAGAQAGEQPVFGRRLAERITVPYPVESLLSGIERREDHMFYRKLVTVPGGWKGKRIKLNFGAVDYQATVWVNGTLVASHTGGYTAFTADITAALTGRGPQEIIVGVTDVTGPDQPKGKQSLNPGGIVYEPSSGIWQTVWMEPVAPVAVDDVVITPDVPSGSAVVRVAAATNAPVTVVARDKKGRIAGRASGTANADLRVAIKNPRLWSPDDPYLYDLDVRLGADRVRGYFGMRQVEVKNVGGFPKLVLNGSPVFSLATLDQGFWPDGLYTQPSDAALRFDLAETKKLGFNAVRKHIKVESARWYRHADELGLLVWQDFVSADITGPAGQDAFLSQGTAMMKQLHNFPSIIGWIVFNEGWGEWDRTATGKIADEVKALDPSRILNAHSGVNCCASKGDSGRGDVIDHHDYNNTDPAYPDATRIAMDGEHGGFTLRTPGHMWPGPPAVIYSGVADKAALTAKYVDNTRRFYLEAAGAELSGSVYTQITDLETELNGLWTYDRREIKVDPAPVREINRAVIAAGAAAAARTYPGRADWTLDEGSGTTAADSSGGDADLTLAGDTTWTTGVTGSALSFDGDGDHADTAGPVLDTTRDYTVAAWVTLDELPGNYATAVSQDGRRTENPFYLQYGQGAFAFSTPGGNRARLITTPELNRWYHLVGVRDHASGQIRLFVDGERVATVAAGPDVVSTGPLSVGRAKYAGNDTDYWSGSVDRVHVYGRTLSDAEVSALHAQEAR
ncbi:putative glycosyl hydrolase [Actinoplanes missouriensis 431]|uniref:Putative glycosyl hydrolase n=1 Tax=Actinoplanes missouriensis (strain ATCC 14538 / DSM 43046 / CBS 188.64 / JCM 3121 / NBRC 102363 / NCIMB 12654 / NRRL B-3342 / UNCC 431) TaxID=512565 RepID=I0H706_ACTM4|nr:glycoside hydrolase family 2 [Actinoplanes missouriensis]BAL88793.1 putative glycosyl hydrolase [Actinoplanes missouriensis 431]